MDTLRLSTVANACNSQDSSDWANAIESMPSRAICQGSEQPLLFYFIKQTQKKYIKHLYTEDSYNTQYTSKYTSLKSVVGSYMFLPWSDTFQYDEHNFNRLCMSIIMNNIRLFEIHYTSIYTCTYTCTVIKDLQDIDALEGFQADIEPYSLLLYKKAIRGLMTVFSLRKLYISECNSNQTASPSPQASRSFFLFK